MKRYLIGILVLVTVTIGVVFTIANARFNKILSGSQAVNVVPQKPVPSPARILQFSPSPSASTLGVVPSSSALEDAKTNTMSGKNAPFGTVFEKNPLPVTPPPPSAKLDPIRDTIQALASTYDAAEVPALAAYLAHDDASIREEARLGLLNLGSSAAVPLLRAAVVKARTPEEAIALRETANFLELPTYQETLKATPRVKTSK
jgi:hypothetical protein